MRIRTKYLLFVIILHITALALSFIIFEKDRILFIVSEIFILLSAALCWQLYNELIQPLTLLTQGAEAIRDKDFNLKFTETGKYEMDQLIQVYNQMTDQLRLERLKQEEQHFFLEKLVYTSPLGIIILDYDGNVQQANPKALALLGMKEETLIGKALGYLDNPVLKQVEELKSGNSVTVTLHGVTTYKLLKAHFIERGFPRHFVIIEELTAEILAAEKKAYGKVIRMMAHEVNNTIGPVNSILQTTLQASPLWQQNETLELQNALQVALDRNNNLNLFMRNFAEVVRLPEPRKKNTDLVKSIRSIAQLMQLKAGEKQEYFRYELPEFFIVPADEQQLEQVLINIIKNAIEAISLSGEIAFKLDTFKRKLEITDTGSGINHATAEQLFSPFFSTKREGQGIGLTLVREILTNHGFEFSLQSVSGKTIFAIKF